MKISSLLLREKTNVGRKTSITFNAPGNYVAPYGKTTVRIGGRGERGYAPSGGNVASPAVPASAYGNGIFFETYHYNSPQSPPFPPNTANSSYGANFAIGSYSFTYNSTTHPSPQSTGSNAPGGYLVDYLYSAVSFTPAQPATYNPYYPGSHGSPRNIGGVIFPGGNNSLAPVIAQTTTTLAYSPSGLTVTVPTGGYITIDNV